MTTRNFEPIRRSQNPELELLIGKVFPVLDDGFVRLIDFMGSDQAVVQAARTSYGAGTKKVNEDRGLIRYLMRWRHTTPLEMCELKIHIRIPMDAWRQMIRHRSASVNEYSTRYSLAIDEKQKTNSGEWRLQSTDNKQGSDGFLPVFDSSSDHIDGEYLTAREAQLHDFAKEIYEERINAGIAREMARKDLPLSTYTEAYWKVDLHNLLHFLSLRMDSHAQKEIRDYANVIGNEIVKIWVPYVWEAFEDYRLGGVTLSKYEVQMIKEIVKSYRDGYDDVQELGEKLKWLDKDGSVKLDKHGNPNRELTEFENKFDLEMPWHF